MNNGLGSVSAISNQRCLEVGAPRGPHKLRDSLDAIYRRLDFARIAQVDLEHKRAIGTREAGSFHSPATLVECSYNFSAKEARGASHKDCFSTHFCGVSRRKRQQAASTGH